MSLSDRDYMRRPASSQEPSRPLEDRVEEMVGGLFNRRRLFLVAGVVLAILVVIALVFAMLS